MEDKIIAALDNLTIDQTENLLSDNFELTISQKDLRRMKKSVYHKIGSNKQRGVYISKKLVAWAAALVIVLTSLSLVGIDNVAAAIDKVLSFIPGYGIIENNMSIDYVLAQPVSGENEQVELLLNNAIATSDSITVMFTLERKNFDENQFPKGEQETLFNDKVVLYTGERKITEYLGYSSGNGKRDTSRFSYDLKPEEIGTEQTYKLEYSDYGISLEFKLENYDSYHSLEDIGATGYNNDISITAVPTFLDGKLQVDLYAINKSNYILRSFCMDDKAYRNDDLRLETNSGVKTYTVPDGYDGVNGRFLFDIQPTDIDFRLKIPCITVKSSEEEDIVLRIPQEGEKVSVNQKIEFKDCIMTIVDVEKTPSHQRDDYGALKMTIEYANKTNNKIMLHPDFFRTNFFGNGQSGSWSAEVDENGIYTVVYFDLDKGESGKLRLKIKDPLYCLTNEYTLAFGRE